MKQYSNGTILSRSILSTLAYHAIFGYPLTIEEIHQFLIVGHPILRKDVLEIVTELVHAKKVVRNGTYYAFPSPAISDLRSKRQKVSIKKLEIARRAAHIIGKHPWVKLVAVTGALAMENASEDDDIDLMMVVAENRLWIVRPIITALTTMFFKRRKPSRQCSNVTMQQFRDAICLNLWVDEEALEIPESQRNLYTAHELAQMKPIFNKDGTYERMMEENRWGRKYLANVWNQTNRQIDKWTNGQIDKTNNKSLLTRPFIYLSHLSDCLLIALNNIFFSLQFQYMCPKMTNERVSLHAAFFHPGDRSREVLRKYQQTRSKLDTAPSI